MTKREYYSTRKDGVKLYKTYSDNGFKIKKVGTNEVYDEAIDVESATFEYEETEEKVDGGNEDIAFAEKVSPNSIA